MEGTFIAKASKSDAETVSDSDEDGRPLKRQPTTSSPAPETFSPPFSPSHVPTITSLDPLTLPSPAGADASCQRGSDPFTDDDELFGPTNPHPEDMLR